MLLHVQIMLVIWTLSAPLLASVFFWVPLLFREKYKIR
jgi:hypothetical protein